MTEQPIDNRPDVEIRLRVRRDISDTNQDHFVEVQGEAHCRFCTETYLSPDPRALVHWADEHEASIGHRFAVAERRGRVLIVPPCPTKWTDGGWRAWRDRVLRGHVQHACDRSSGLPGGHIGEHVCECGARCDLTIAAAGGP